MNSPLLYAAGSTPAFQIACRLLQQKGYRFAPEPAASVTHVLLPVPSLDGKGIIKGGCEPDALLQHFSRDITILGGNLDLLSSRGYSTIDLLKEESYLCENAAITADCALRIARNALPCVLPGLPVVILGWGRIGKHLARLLQAIGAKVTVLLRNEKDQSLLQSMGYTAGSYQAAPALLSGCRLLFNTVPEVTLTAEALSVCCDCVKIDLASKKGIPGEDVIWARGLPGTDAPESSGRLIAKTIQRYLDRRY